VARPTADRAIGVGLLTLGVLLLAVDLGSFLPKGLVWSAAVCALGFGLVWARTSDEGRARWLGLATGRTTAPVDSVARGRVLVLRAIAGGALLVVGLVFLFASGGLLSFVGQVGLAMVATGVGVALLLGPWMVRLWRERESERRQRIRSEERSEMAAHLHDSVLQTLALIQRSADDAPGRARMLARRQERELRAWLNGRRASGEQTVALALESAAAEVEEAHGVPIEVVAVGDAPLDERAEALVAAAREAMVNAAKFAGPVALYAEVDDERIEVFVRDRGPGFDPAAVPGDRRGVSESIVGRMERHGGRAVVHTAPGEGTEIELVMQR
jgi:signal transduction histidine kinase